MPDVCVNCGLPLAAHHACCPRCNSRSILTPDPEMIRQRCEAIRARWPAYRLARQEGHAEELEIPTATKVTDHMVRNQDPGG